MVARERWTSMISFFPVSLSFSVTTEVEQLGCGSDPVGGEKISEAEERGGVGLSLGQGQCLTMEGQPCP